MPVFVDYVGNKGSPNQPLVDQSFSVSLLTEKAKSADF